MIKIIILLLLVVLATAYALGLFFEVGLGEMSIGEFTEEYLGWLKDYLDRTEMELRDRVEAIRGAISKPDSP